MKKSAVAAAVGLALSVQYQGAHALPEGGQVTAGQGGIGTAQNGSLVVTQQSNRLAIDWMRFGIGVGESVRFDQPGASAIALNRVIGNDPSHIYGSLSANGQVFLLNPNGVLFAPGSQVNVGGLVASTLGLSNEDFMAGRYVFSRLGKAGSVTNQGEITAGYAALLGQRATNEGVITARLGTVALAAGEQITLKLGETSLVGLTVDKGALDALAENKHMIRADGGTVILTAKATDAILRHVVNNDGIIEARSLSERDGVIRLESTGTGITSVNGSLEAKEIVVTGDKVGLYQHADLTAPSGTILVGGNFQGKGPERNSSATYVAPGATLNADAAGEGDGGRVIVWSDGATAFYGHLSARGGPLGGNGGFAEVSGKENLIFAGWADLTAPRGLPGSILFDPKNIIVEDQATGVIGDVDLFTAGGGGNTASIDADVITTLTNAGIAVFLRANNNITVDEAIVTSNGSGDGGNLNFRAGNSIFINAGITTDNGNLTLVANDTLASGVQDAQRDPGNAASIQIAGAAPINAGTGTVSITIADGAGRANTNSGSIALGPITAATLSVTNAGPDSAANNIAQASPVTISGTTSVNTGGGTFDVSANLSTDVLTVTGGVNHTAGTLSVNSGSISGLYDFSSPGGLFIDTGTLTLNGGMNWTGGTISGTNAASSNLAIASGTTALLSGGNRALGSNVTYRNFGTTQINLPVGNALSVPITSILINESVGVVEFLADGNAITGGGGFTNFGLVRNGPSAGTNTVSVDFLAAIDSTWQASTGRLDIASSTANFFDTTTITGNGVYFTAGAVTYNDFLPNPQQINGTFNLDGADLHVENGISLDVNNTLNWTGGTISGTNAASSNLVIASGATALLSGGNRALGSGVTYRNFGTTQINLPVGNALSVPITSILINESVGVVEFLADGNAITGSGGFTNFGLVRNGASAGTNTISVDFLAAIDSTWQASTGRLDIASSTANFFDTTTITGNGVFFTAGTVTYGDFLASPQQINGTVNLDGAALEVNNTTLTVNGPVNLHSAATISTLSNGSLSFLSTIDGANDLTITTNGTGTVTFGGAIGSNTPLADLSITTGQALSLPLTTVTGNLHLTTGGDISQFGRLIVGGTADFDAGGGEVGLNLLANDFQSAVAVTSTGAAAIHQISDANDLTLGAVSIEPGAQLRLQTGGSGTATGHLTQTVPLSMTQLSVQTLSNTTSDISLGLPNFMTNTTNPFNLENVGSGSWGNVSLRNDFGAGSLALNFNGAWATITGNLDVRTITGINQVGNVLVGGSTMLDAGGGTVSLQNVGNDFGGPVSVTGTAATDHRVTDANDLQLGAVDIHTNANLILQTGAAGSATGHLTQTVPLGTLATPMSRLRVETRSNTTSNITLNLANFMSDTHEPFKLDNFGAGTWGDVRLRNDFVNGDLQLNPAGSWAQITGVLHVQTGAGISQVGPVVVGGATTLDAGMGIIDLQNIGNDFQGPINLTSTAGSINRVTDANNLQLGTIDLGLFGNLSVQTGASGMDTGHLTQTVPFGTLMNPFMGQIQVQTLSNNPATSDITLNLANFMSNTTEPFVLQNLGTGTWGNVSLRNDFGAGAFSVNNSGGWGTISGNLSIQALTGITQANPITVVGTSRFETSNAQIQITHFGNDFQDTVTPVGGTNVAVFQGGLHDLKVAPLTAQQLTLSSGAGVDLSAGTYGASVGPLSLSAGTTIDLVTGPVTFSGANGITINGNVAGPGALVMNQTNTTTGSITVNGSLGTFGSRLGGLTINEANSVGVQLGTATAFVDGDLDVTSPAFIVMGSLAVSGTSHFQTNNHIVQLEGNNDFVGEVTVLGGALTSINQNSLNPLRVAPLTTDRLRLQSQQSNIALRAGTYQAAFDTLDIAALGGGAITLGAGTVTLDAASGLTLAGNVEGPGALVLNQHGVGASFSIGGTLGTSGARLAGLTIDNAGLTGVELSGSGAFVTGDLDITSAADIRLGTSAVSGTSRFEAANAPVVINGNNDFVGLVTVTGGNEVWIAQNSPNPLRVAPLSTDFMFLDSQQSNVQLTAGTYEATLGEVRIQASGGNSIALGAGTVTLDAQNGVHLTGNVAGPGALSIHQRSAGGLISVNGSLGTSAARLGGLTIDDQSTIGMPLGTTQAFVSGNVDITAGGPIQFGAMAVSGTSRFDFQSGVQAGVNIFDPGNDFGGVVTVVDGTFVFLAHSGLGPLRVAPLTAENTTILSWQSDIQLSAGTYEATVGSFDIGTFPGNAIALGAGTVTVTGANGVSFGSEVHGPGGLVVNQTNPGALVIADTLGTSGSPLASLAIHNASTLNFSLNDVNATGAVAIDTAGDLTLPLGTVVSSSGNDVVLAGANFVNNAGSGALSAAGRWLVYSSSPAGSTEGGLAGAGVRLYNRTFAANPPASIAAGNHLVYVSQPTLAVTANNQSRSYGDANPAFTLSIGGLVSDDGYTDTASDALLTGAATTTATTTSPVAGSPYAITQGTVASGAGYAVSFTDGQLTVSPRPITVTADAGQAKVYGNVDPTFTYALTSGNLVGADTLSGALARAAGENVGAYAINQGTLANANYGITFASNNFGITQRPIGVTADAGQAKTYGAADPTLAYSITSGSLVGGDTLSGALGRAAGENVGAYAMNQGTLANANYGITFTGNNFGVLPAPLVVDAADATKVSGSPNPPFSATYSGFVLGDDPSTLGGALGFSTPATTLSPAGSYPVTPLGLTSTNYAITFVDGVLTVTPAPVTPPTVAVVVDAGRAYLDTLSGIQGSRIAAPLPIEYDRMVTIENGGMRLPEGLQP